MTINRTLATLFATPVLLLVLTASADAYREPVLFSVLNDGLGRATMPNDVQAFSPDGAHVFLSSGAVPGRWPDGTNMAILFPGMLGLFDQEEIDALSWGDDFILHPDVVMQGQEIEFYFSVDSMAVGVPGAWAPDVFTEAPVGAEGDIFFAWPIFWPYGGNHLGVPERITGLRPRAADLDALTFHKRDVPDPGLPVYFSVDRVTCGLPGTAVRFQCNNPAIPAQAADVFLSFGGGSNQLFADEVTMGLDWNDDNIDAMVVFDTSPQGGPNHQLDPGLDQIYFSVDFLTFGLPGTAVNVEALGGSIQGDVFWSDFTGGNVKVLDGTQLGLLEPPNAQPFVPDEDNLNALETEFWMDRDGDQIPDNVDNCPDDPNPMQLDGDLNGIGDVCDPTGVEIRRDEDAGEFGIRSVEPNPFRATVRLAVSLPEEGAATVEVFGLDGRRVATLTNRHFAPGSYSLTWDGRDAAGDRVAAGMYFVRLKAGKSISTEKLTLID